MEDPKELLEKQILESEDPTNKSSIAAPVIETPVPPQVMDPSAPPDVEGKRPSTDKRKRLNRKNYVKIDNKQSLEKNTSAWF